jgi:hypothetical protein
MKILAIALVVTSLVGCASRGGNSYGSQQAISYTQLQSIKVTSKDCSNIDSHVNFVEQQLRLKGLINANPEDLNEDDRKYNATARSIIWALRIGCNNPNRYKQ